MSKNLTLKLNGEAFPNANDPIVLTNYKYSAKRMGNAPTITATVNYPVCLDSLWTDEVYVEFRGERYYLKAIPTSSKDNTSALYKYQIELVSERIALEHVYFFDVVTEDTTNDRPVSNNSTFSFSLDIEEFIARINRSMKWSGLDYVAVLDEGVEKQDKLYESQDQYLLDALNTAYELYEIPYYFVGKTIHFGYEDVKINDVFRYGCNDALMSITKNVTSADIVNRITGVGSDRNITYYYPNPTPKGYISLYDESNGLVSITDFDKFADDMPVDVVFEFDRGLLNKGMPYAPNYVYKIPPSGGYGAELDIDEAKEYTAYIKDNNGLYNDRYSVRYPLGFLAPGDYKLRLQVLPKTLQVGNEADFAYKVSVNNYGIETTRIDSHTLVVHIDESINASDLSFVIEFAPAPNAQIPLTARFSLPKLQSMELDSFKLINTSNGKEVKIANFGLSVGENIPRHGAKIKQVIDKRVNVQNNLMPPKYRATDGKDRFYNAINDTYENADGEYYEFNNPYTSVRPREYIYSDDEIYPTITGITNAKGQRIDAILDVAFDDGDNDDIYPVGDENEGKYKHPYFFIKLRKTDGEFGFNLFDSAIEDNAMTISFKTGKCTACSFNVGVGESTNKNTVRVDDNGNLMRDEEGNVLCNRPGQPVYEEQPQQQDTRNNEVWIALQKEDQTFGVIMPNKTENFRPVAGDEFVILHINLPDAYVFAAEKRLEDAIIKHMHENNDYKFSYNIKLSSIFFEENPSIANVLTENSKVSLEYGGIVRDLYVTSYSYDVKNSSALPTVQIEVDDTIKIFKGAFDRVKEDIDSSYKKPLLDVRDNTSKIGSKIINIGYKADSIKSTADRAMEQSTSALEENKAITATLGDVQLSVSDVEAIANLAQADATQAKEGVVNIGNEIGAINTSINKVQSDATKALSSVANATTRIEQVADSTTAEVTRINESIYSMDKDIASLESLIGDEYNIWFEEGDSVGKIPTLDNFPAKDWDEDDYEDHDRDLYYSQTLGRAWRFNYNDGNPLWEEITDADTITALTKAQEALDKANEAIETVEDVKYLKDIFGETEVEDSKAAVLGSLLAVTDVNDKITAGMYGGGIGALDDNGFVSESHDATLMIFAGANGVGNVKDAEFRVYSDGCMYANHGTFGGILKRSIKNISKLNLAEYSTVDSNDYRVLDLAQTGSFIDINFAGINNLNLRLPWYSSSPAFNSADSMNDVLSLVGTEIIIKYKNFAVSSNLCFEIGIYNNGEVTPVCANLAESGVVILRCKAGRGEIGINVGWETSFL